MKEIGSLPKGSYPNTITAYKNYRNARGLARDMEAIDDTTRYRVVSTGNGYIIRMEDAQGNVIGYL